MVGTIYFVHYYSVYERKVNPRKAMTHEYFRIKSRLLLRYFQIFFLMDSQNQKLIVITGANKGIGYGLVDNLIQKPFRIIMACRNLKLAEEARAQLLEKHKVDPSRLEVLELDIGESSSIDKFVENFAARGLKADVLVNNAAIAFKGDAFNEDIVAQTFKPNLYGTIEFTEKFLPLLNTNGKIVTFGSRGGQIYRVKSEALIARIQKPDITKEELFQLAKEFQDAVRTETVEEKGWTKAGYGTGKLFLNTFARILARYPIVVQNNIQVYQVCPGYVKTEFSSFQGKSVEEGIETPIWLIELPHVVKPEYQGQFFYDGAVGVI